MERYSREQRIEIIKLYYQNHSNFADTCRDVQVLFCEAPSQQIIMNIVNNFERVGHVGDTNTPIRNDKVRSPKVIKDVIARPGRKQVDAKKSSSKSTRHQLGNVSSARSRSIGKVTSKSDRNINKNDKTKSTDVNNKRSRNQSQSKAKCANSPRRTSRKPKRPAQR